MEKNNPSTSPGKLVVICTAAYMEERVRLYKLKESLENIPFEYWGWLRQRTDRKHVDYPIKHLLSGGGYHNSKLRFFYPVFIIKLFFKLLFFKKKTHFYAVALDTAFPAYLASRINRKITYTFDNPDNFSLTHNLKGFLKSIVEYAEDKTAKRAKHHIIPGRSRFAEKHGNEVYIPNSPMESQYQKALKIFNDPGTAYHIPFAKLKEDKRFKIYSNGRMLKERGSEWIARILDKLPENDYLFMFIGRMDCKKLSEKLKHIKNAIVTDRVPNEEALAAYMCADVVLTFYDPVLPINIKAESNKWWDCVKTNTPFIANSEIETLDIFLSGHACFTVPYDNDSALIKLLENIGRHSAKTEKVRKNLLKIETPDWKAMIRNYVK